METCIPKDLEEMKAAEAVATKVEIKSAEAVAAEEEMRTAEAMAEEGMNTTDFVVAYKRLPKREIEFILAHGMIPFESTTSYDNLITDTSTTKEDLDREAAEYKEVQEGFARFQDEVRREYEATGVFRVDDDYIAKRVVRENMIHEAWSTMFDETDLQELVFGYQSDFDFDDLDDDLKDGANVSATDSTNVEERLLCKL